MGFWAVEVLHHGVAGDDADDVFELRSLCESREAIWLDGLGGVGGGW